jgi:hypothetical protein
MSENREHDDKPEHPMLRYFNPEDVSEHLDKPPIQFFNDTVGPIRDTVIVTIKLLERIKKDYPIENIHAQQYPDKADLSELVDAMLEDLIVTRNILFTAIKYIQEYHNTADT